MNRSIHEKEPPPPPPEVPPPLEVLPLPLTGAAVTVSTTTWDVLAMFWLSPLYAAEMLWLPTASAEVL
jgi:hypothetical protein